MVVLVWGAIGPKPTQPAQDGSAQHQPLAMPCHSLTELQPLTPISSLTSDLVLTHQKPFLSESSKPQLLARRTLLSCPPVQATVATVHIYTTHSKTLFD